MKKTDKRRNATMEEVSKGYEEFIKRQKIKNNGTAAFNKAIKKAAKPKPRASK